VNVPHPTSPASRPVPVIAIDGPAASGKSSTAAAVARALGFVHIDSGSLYRALTWVSVRHGTDDPKAIAAIAESLNVALRLAGDRIELHVDGSPDVEAAIRTPEVNAHVSAIAAMTAVRDWVNVRLRAALQGLNGAVVDGRDIGTIVVPEAELKIFLTASPAARAERRLAQWGGGIDQARLTAETAALAERDRRDAGRAIAPLQQAPDAVVLDTTALTFQQQVDRIVHLAASRGLPPPRRADIL
jgi:cytidylate kinase